MASSVNFSGLGSGIDFGVVRDAIIAQRSKPVTLLQNKVSSFSNRIDALKQLNASLAVLTTAAEALTVRDLGAGRTATPVNTAVATASAASSAGLGNYNLNITRLASNLAQASRSFSSTSDPILAGGATAATFELRQGGSATGTAITIDSSNNSLAGLRDAINAANAGVTASIIDVNGDGTGQELVLNSATTGASGRVELVETTSTGTLTDLNIRSLNPPDGDFTKLDASLSVNGLGIIRATNTISDAIAGVTLNLKTTGTTNVAVTESTDIEAKINSFVTAYNAVQSLIAKQYSKDASGHPTGVLAGDSTLRSAQTQVRDALGAVSDTNGGAFTSLAEIGVAADNNGVLSLDSAVFNAKLKSNPDDVKALLYGKTVSDQGVFQKFDVASKGLSDSISGSVQTAIVGYQTSITSLNSTITDRLAALDRLKTSLTNQFAAADAAIGQLNGQGTALTNIIKSLQGNSRN